ncbi:MAG: cytochrome b N-terminal domain-containing protein [Melioribacteraceae bacterium]|nr:cytochrome b N-terminal domain-containing protein [Melioribacteraceae bacterium]MCF8355577.1 cytochrome b N-terminal domain-containing protein [Melioribacteraceae bacterium]MCF8395044.1 cytochrome b N-terminal domain-containing protein [Melioribacteraceae bacterium]MCF8420498.1 cytochrome b N-terminal domain-containing protein [Melioribacteraceae bacterium]
MNSFLDSKTFNWLDSRYNLDPIKKLILHKKVPVHKHTIWYYMGGVTLFLFMIQVFTGILLLMYYQPGESSAFESVRLIVTKVKFGWLIRNLHSWSANLMIFFAFVHMFSVFFTKAYEKPRELTWVSGFLLLVLGMAFGFSGYLLPWNELAFFATKVGTDIVGAVPFVGEELKLVLRGGQDVTGATLSRFFGIHAAILPAIFTLILIFHLLMVQRQGMSEPEFFKKLPENKKKYISFLPDFALRDFLLWLIVFYFLIFLALFFQWDLGLKADALAPAPQGIKPEWYFMFMFQSLKLLPPHIWFIEGETFGVLFFTFAGLVWMLVPFIKLKSEKFQKRNVIIITGIVVVAFIVGMTIYGYLE